MRRQLLVLGGIAVVCAALAYALSLAFGETGPRTALGAAPEGSSLVARVDVPALRASPLWAAMVDEDDAGLERITEACGFDPIERAHSLVVFVVGTPERPLERLGFLARGDFPRERLVECLERVVEADGGGLRPVTIEGVRAIASEHGASRAAFLGRDGIVGGDEGVVREVILVSRGDAPSAERDEALARLWERVAARADVIVAARLPSHWRQWLGRLGEGIEIGTIAHVRAVGLGARVHDGLGVTLALETDGAPRAEALAGEVRARLEALHDDPTVRLSAAGGTLRRIDLEVRAGDVLATLDLDGEQLASVVELARLALASRREAAARERAARVREHVPAPDEQLRARPSE